MTRSFYLAPIKSKGYQYIELEQRIITPVNWSIVSAGDWSRVLAAKLNAPIVTNGPLVTNFREVVV